MAKAPLENVVGIIHTYWHSLLGLMCPLCHHHLHHAFNDGGRSVDTLKGMLWVVTNYYYCSNPKCELNDAFPAVYPSVLARRQHGLDVWAKVVQHHFKHHLNCELISEMMWDDWQVSISAGEVRIISEYFEAAGTLYLDAQVVADVQKNGGMVISVDGAQPVHGEPSLYSITELRTGHTLMNPLLECASGEILCQLYRDLETQLKVPIVGLVSDKGNNIVKSRELFRASLPHAYCQFHFLDHIAEPIAAKDSHLLTSLRETVRKFAIVKSDPRKLPLTHPDAEDKVGEILAPLREELLCAIACEGNRFEIFPGLETYANLEYIDLRIESLMQKAQTQRLLFSLSVVRRDIGVLLNDYREMRDDLVSMCSDFRFIRQIFAQRTETGYTIRGMIELWVEQLQDRLVRLELECNPERIKHKISKYNTTRPEAWQQWIRLVSSYEEGIYTAYDHPELSFTNNEKEQLFHRIKAHFRSMLGQVNMASAFQRHGGIYAQISELEFTEPQISQVLLANEQVVIAGQHRQLHAQYAVIRRQWRIREVDTGNFTELEQRLDQIKK